MAFTNILIMKLLLKKVLNELSYYYTIPRTCVFLQTYLFILKLLFFEIPPCIFVIGNPSVNKKNMSDFIFFRERLIAWAVRGPTTNRRK